MEEAALRIESTALSPEPAVARKRFIAFSVAPLTKLWSAVVVSALALAFAVVHDYSAAELTPDIFQNLAFTSQWVSSLASLILIALLSPSIFSAAWSEAESGKLGTSICRALLLVVLAAGAVFGAAELFLSKNALWSSFEIPILLSILTFLEWIGLRLAAIGRATEYRLQQHKVSIKDSNEEWREESAKAVKVGQIFKVQSGQQVPLDGLVLEGVAEIKGCKWTPFRRNTVQTTGSEIKAGSYVVRGLLICRAVNTYEDSTVHTVWSGLRAAKESVQENEREESAVSIAVIFLACCTALFWHDQGLPWQRILPLSTGVLLLVTLYDLRKTNFKLIPISLVELFLRGIGVRSAESVKTIGQLPTVLIDYNSDENALSVKEFSLLDERVDRISLDGVIVALLGACSEPWAEAIREFVLGQEQTVPLLEAQEVHSYNEKGVCGVLQKTDFSVGTEQFLLERGVRFEVSEVSDGGDGYYFVAVNDEVVARYKVVSSFRLQLEELVRQLKPLGRRICIGSSGERVDAETWSKTCDLEPGDIIPHMSDRILREKLLALQPLLFSSGTRATLAADFRGSVSATYFDEFLWNLKECQVMFFRRDLKAFFELISVCGKVARFLAWNTFAICALAGMLLLGVSCGLIDPIQTALLVLIALVGFEIYIKRMFPLVRFG